MNYLSLLLNKYVLSAIGILVVIGGVYFLNKAYEEIDSLKAEKKEIIESIVINQKIEDAKTKAETTIKVSKKAYDKSIKDLNEAKIKRGAINEVSNDDFISFSF